MSLHPRLEPFLSRRGWRLHPHQEAMLAHAGERAVLLVAPTGAGKTLAGFLPSLIDLASGGREGLHTLYVSPLKALAADIRRNLLAPVEELGLPVRVEDRTGDTPQAARRRQRAEPPHILLTTPESLALLLSHEDAPHLFAGLQRVVVDEIHALAESKRGDQLFLLLSRLEALAPGFRRVGLSATVEDPEAMGRCLAPAPRDATIVRAPSGAEPDLSMMSRRPPPWAGGAALHAIPEVLDLVRAHRCTLVFHNTRAQAELFFHHLWMQNDEGLPIAIHHGSLAREQRQAVEAAMQRGELRAVVCTGTLDMGLDWGEVDLVIQMGAPKYVKRLVQRIGRANHRAGGRSRAVLVPAHRFEVIECVCAIEAAREGDLDGQTRGPGPLDVLCQHILIRACSGPFAADDLYAEVRTAGPYRDLPRADFDACLDFCATGGYALRAYDRWRRLVEHDGLWRLRDPRSARRIRMNLGTIEDKGTLKVRLRGSQAPLGEVEEYFASTLSPGDTFLIGGQIVRFESLREASVEVSRRRDREPRVPAFGGGKFPTSVALTRRILGLIEDRSAWVRLPRHTAEWLDLQARISRLPAWDRLLIETFPAEGRWHAALWGFAGWNAHQTLGLLLTRRMEAEGLDPLGFVATDHALLISGLRPVEAPARLLEPEGLRDGFEGWLAGNAVMKRTFRGVATIAGLIERQMPGLRRTGRQATFSSDILYDTLQRYDPGHLLLRVTREEAQRGLVDWGRIEEMLARVGPRIDHVRLTRVPPLAAPLLLERGRVPVEGRGRERLAEEAAARLLEEAGLDAL
ncbi:ligase-associated DNA damage response DEXH box helicase [Rubellimicrobium sp. CFH 75288]|uniref:ligase-associated DNA damage response DEXH box helicase n=1 Tax=Rubellimicrobium sp. CFH 75288 TaxID=2697034 RepID=UPI0014132CB0|nr:ligase-associated DNA damage response DEXH box helicase [Rubellimicrobium sp. CFH 75288]NAZ36677.1 ligase-associated DNA damage response DEXH box helicase [Rubellimicrobium sp. CFH 75288]